MKEVIISYHRPMNTSVGDMLHFNHMISNGKNVRELEEEVKNLYNIDHVIACSSCSIGLLITLQAFDAISNWNWSVYTPAFAWFSSKWAIENSNNKPVFLDVDKNTWLMEPQDVLDVALPVHTFGSVHECDYQFTFYDGAHALGAKIKDFGKATVFSLAPTKLITACEGGLILTNDSELAAEINKLRDKVSRMSELNALWGLETLERLDDVLEWKKSCYNYYKTHLKGQFQEIPHASNFNTIGFLTDYIMPSDVEFKKYYVPLKKGFKNTNYVYGKMICLPSWFGVDLEYIVDRILGFNERFRKNE